MMRTVKKKNFLCANHFPSNSDTNMWTSSPCSGHNAETIVVVPYEIEEPDDSDDDDDDYHDNDRHVRDDESTTSTSQVVQSTSSNAPAVVRRWQEELANSVRDQSSHSEPDSSEWEMRKRGEKRKPSRPYFLRRHSSYTCPVLRKRRRKSKGERRGSRGTFQPSIPGGTEKLTNGSSARSASDSVGMDNVNRAIDVDAMDID